MKRAALLVSFGSLALIGCGSDAGSDDEPTPAETVKAFNPPPPAEGYTRIVAPVMKDIAPGQDVMHCQYVFAPVDRDLDILDMDGFQSAMGHHAVAYATTADVPTGSTAPCGMEENLPGGFLGGVGGEGGGGVDLPEGVAFRLPKGNAIMLNTHFLNVGDEPVDGETVLDVKFAEVDPNRKVASLFANVAFGFNIPAHSAHAAATECTFPKDMEFILFNNHMHDYGVTAKTEIVRSDGKVELVHEDPIWTYEMQFRSTYTQWSLEQPLKLAEGDILRTHCEWNNQTAEAIGFPREMCVGVGFFISDGSTSPVCGSGAWIER